jgi:hypothetical protein
LTIDRFPGYDACVAAAQVDTDISFPADGYRQPHAGQPVGGGGGPSLVFVTLMLLLLGGLALLIWVIQPFADQVGGCGGG